MHRLAVAVLLAAMSLASAAWADDPLPLCPWTAHPPPAGRILPAPGCGLLQTEADGRVVVAARGCCQKHQGPCGCDADSHRVTCCDGVKSTSCTC
jgi:hypothetical protein